MHQYLYLHIYMYPLFTLLHTVYYVLLVGNVCFLLIRDILPFFSLCSLNFLLPIPNPFFSATKNVPGKTFHEFFSEYWDSWISLSLPMQWLYWCSRIFWTPFSTHLPPMYQYNYVCFFWQFILDLRGTVPFPA